MHGAPAFTSQHSPSCPGYRRAMLWRMLRLLSPGRLPAPGEQMPSHCLLLFSAHLLVICTQPLPRPRIDRYICLSFTPIVMLWEWQSAVVTLANTNFFLSANNPYLNVSFKITLTFFYTVTVCQKKSFLFLHSLSLKLSFLLSHGPLLHKKWLSLLNWQSLSVLNNGSSVVTHM